MQMNVTKQMDMIKLWFFLVTILYTNGYEKSYTNGFDKTIQIDMRRLW